MKKVLNKMEYLTNWLLTGSYTETGEKLGVTKQAVEWAIKATQKRLGVTSKYRLMNYCIRKGGGLEFEGVSIDYDNLVDNLTLNQLKTIMGVTSNEKTTRHNGDEMLRRCAIKLNMKRMILFRNVCLLNVLTNDMIKPYTYGRFDND